MSDAKTPPTPAPSGTILIVRDGAKGLEVFMVKRHHQIDFASGALVFPGGKLAAGDRDPALRAACDGADGVDDLALAVRAGTIREAFEEAGLLFARDAQSTSGYVMASRMANLFPWRAKLDKGEAAIGELLAQESLRLAIDALIPFAHWVTPVMMPKRFDTYFFLAAAPEDQLGLHDGGEAVDSLWIRPLDALADADAKRATIIFPTRMQLKMLSSVNTVAEALAEARARPVVTVLPWVEQGPDGKPQLKIPPDAGYGDITEELERAVKG